MKREKFLGLRFGIIGIMLIMVVIGLVVHNYVLSVISIFLGMGLLFISRKSVKGIINDERENNIIHNASHLAFFTLLTIFSLISISLLFLSIWTRYLELWGVLFSYLTLFVLFLYITSYFYFSFVLGGGSDNEE